MENLYAIKQSKKSNFFRFPQIGIFRKLQSKSKKNLIWKHTGYNTSKIGNWKYTKRLKKRTEENFSST
jgi:hypothetical protein